MRILVDAMGGDLAPDEIVKGAVHAQQELGAEIVLVGQRAAIEACLRNEQAKLEIIDASEVITWRSSAAAAPISFTATNRMRWEKPSKCPTARCRL